MRAILVLFLALNSFISNAQFEYFTVDPDRYTFHSLEGLGESLGKPDETIAFGYNTSEDSLVIAVLQDKQALVIGLVLNEYFFNATKSNDVFWRNDSIFISSEMPYRATQYSFEFVWDKKSKGFFANEPQMTDPSWEALSMADSLLAGGNIKTAIDYYYQVMYPHAYMNEGEVGIRLMETAHKKALSFFKETKYDSAVHYMAMVLDYYPNSNYISFKDENDFNSIINDSSSWQQSWNPEQAQLWLGDYGLFLYKAKKYDESIALNSYLNMILPDMAGPYLQLGDSYYDSGKKTEAKTAYKKYSALKKEQKKEKDIPKRVKERMK